MVNATLQVMRYVMAVDRPDAQPMEFHKFAHMSATAYPIKSNKEIRRSLSEYPIDANLFWVLTKPTSPHEEAWHYFVECDDAVHRIYRLPPKRWENSGIDIMTSSQWFIASREFTQYLAQASPGTFVYDYLQYIEHAVVADEQFFGTILRHSAFCHKHENKNFLFLEFGEYVDLGESIGLALLIVVSCWRPKLPFPPPSPLLSRLTTQMGKFYAQRY